jgi:hypothetical protein
MEINSPFVFLFVTCSGQKLGQHDKEGKEEKDGIGSSEMEQGSGHAAEDKAARVKRDAPVEQSDENSEEPEKKKRKPGKVDEQRTLGQFLTSKTWLKLERLSFEHSSSFLSERCSLSM